MVAGRVLQGLAAGVIPLGISIMRDELPAEKLGSATFSAYEVARFPMQRPRTNTWVCKRWSCSRASLCT